MRSFQSITYLIIFCSLLASNVVAHIVMSEPPPINYKTSPYYDESKADFDYTAPLSPSGSNYPCRGMLKYLGTSVAQSVRTYAPGGTYELKFDGSASHGGGSCQISLSYDKGSTWTVIESLVGGCPGAQSGSTDTFHITIPADAPPGEVLYAWSWFNHEGNREMYMNCAVVTISSQKRLGKRSLSGPNMFIANLGNGCSTAAGTDVIFPDPGANIQYNGNPSSRAPPVGNCGPVLVTPPPPPSTSPGNGGDPGTLDNGNNSGNDNTNNNNNNPGSQTPPDPFSGQSEGIEGGNEGISKDCAYWRSQGFVCSAAIPSRLVQLWDRRFRMIMGLFWWAYFGWILCGF